MRPARLCGRLWNVSPTQTTSDTGDRFAVPCSVLHCPHQARFDSSKSSSSSQKQFSKSCYDARPHKSSFNHSTVSLQSASGPMSCKVVFPFCLQACLDSGRQTKRYGDASQHLRSDTRIRQCLLCLTEVGLRLFSQYRPAAPFWLVRKF